MYLDKLGYPIQLGDTIAYIPTGLVSSYSSINIGVVTELANGKLKTSCIQILRACNTVVNITYMQPLEDVKNKNPEFFI